MTTQPSNVSELIASIRQGMVPRSVRLFAAQGLLPVAREDLIRLLVLLCVEGDEEIAATARDTLGSFESAHFQGVLGLPDLEPLDLDLLARALDGDDDLHQRIARHPRVADETLLWLARHSGPRVQDAIVTNQIRLISCLEIIEGLRANPNVSQDVLRRVREFEEEFLEKAVVWATAGEDAEGGPEPGISIVEALEALKALGMTVPTDDIGPEPPPEPEPGAEPEVHDAFQRIFMMNTFQKVMQALKGSREDRMVLVRDRSLLVIRAVMSSPKLSDSEVEQIARLRAVNDEALRLIAGKGRWLRRYSILRSLVFNPKTPPQIARQLVGRLSFRDLNILGRDRNVAEAVRRQARERAANRV